MKPTHAIRSSGRVSTTAGVCWANVSHLHAPKFENLVPAGRYGRDDDAVW